ncbi:MAG TPA: outer membrane beta-barrel protein [Pseudomonadales bacterium]|nr:outer membrane beta-barrel protein [Pseudomonadales bacterium]
MSDSPISVACRPDSLTERDHVRDIRSQSSGGNRCGGALIAGSSAAPAAAAGPRYTYGEVGYSRVDFDHFSEDADVGAIAGSFAIADHWYLVADYSYGTIDNTGADVDLQNADAGVGFHVALDDRVDFIAEAAYAWARVEADRFSDDDDGYALKAGIRAMLTPQFELNAGGTYVDISGDDQKAGYVGAVYNFTDMFAVTGTISAGDDATAYSVGLRLYFAPRI